MGLSFLISEQKKWLSKEDYQKIAQHFSLSYPPTQFMSSWPAP